MAKPEGITRVSFDKEARDGIFSGIEIVADAVGSTLGPMGRCVVIERADGTPYVTKDGVTVSRSINLRDRLQSLGAELVKEAASKTNELAGDGTTTATVLTHAMCEHGRRLLAGGHPPVKLARAIDAAVRDVVTQLKQQAVPVKDEDLARVATISANGESSIGDLIARAVEHVGRDGIVTVEESKSAETTLDVVKGMRIDRGFLSPYFVTDAERMRCVLDDTYVLVTDEPISSLAEFVPVLEGIHRQGKPLLIIAPDVEGEALQMLVVNRMQNNLQCCVVSAPGYDFGPQRTEALLDVCALMGAQLCTTATGGLSGIKMGDLGRLRRVIAGRSTTTLVAAKQTGAITERADQVRTQLEDPNLDESTTLILRDRLAKLVGSAAIIRVGGATEIEMAERRDRVDDALNATRAAIEEGIVVGGGAALVHAVKEIDNDEPGKEIVVDACFAPMARLVDNAGQPSQVIIEKVSNMEAGRGYNAYEGRFQDLIEHGVIDPVKVVRVALENAASVAKAFLTLSAAVVHDSDD